MGRLDERMTDIEYIVTGGVHNLSFNQLVNEIEFLYQINNQLVNTLKFISKDTEPYGDYTMYYQIKAKMILDHCELIAEGKTKSGAV